jgi:RNA polymerase sigma factor (sigma-70 family)
MHRLACLVNVNRTSDTLDLTDPATAPIRARPQREAAFRQLADVQLDRAYGLARAILRDQSEARDATHDAFVQAWRKWGTLRDPARFEAWFDRILVNTCRNRLRSKNRLARDISAEVALVAGDHVKNAEDREVIGAALAALSPDHQIVVALRFYRDLPLGDIADRLGIAEGTVRSRLHYALKRLHAAIQATDPKGTDR